MLSVIIYIMVFLTVIILYRLSLSMKNKNKILYYAFKILSFLILAFFVCFRYDVGTDYFNYTNLYSYFNKIDIVDIFNYRIEPGVVLLYKISNLISDNSITIIVTLSLVTLLALYSSLNLIEKSYNDEIDSSLSLACFLFLFLPFCLNGMRQGIAMVICLMAILNLKNNKTIKSIIFCCIAMLFHSSAIITLIYTIIYVIFRKKKSYIKPIIFTLTMCLIIFFSPTFLLNFSFFEKYTTYLSSDLMAINKSYIVLLILNLPLLLLIIMKRKKIKDDDKMLYGLWISSQVLYFFCSFLTYMNRLSLYLEMISIVLIPLLFKETNKKRESLIIKIICIAYLIIYFIIHFYIFGSHDIFPYQNYFYI